MYEEKVAEMMAKMTLEDKLNVLTPIANHYGSVPSLNFYGPVPQDVPRGGADNWKAGKASYDEEGKPNDGQYHPVAYPSNSSVAMSWDKKLAFHVGERFGMEAKANPEPVNILNRPALNLKRSPLCGRNYDYLSEDPVLTGIIATEYAKGIQSTGIGSCPKHFIANNQEFDRMNTNSIIDERTMQEVYLRPWKMLLREAKPPMIMSSYNKVNGEWVNSNPEVMRLLREDIGYDGIIVSDFLAIHQNKVASHKLGMEIELADAAVHIQEMRDAIEDGIFTIEELDKLVRRILEFSLRLKDQESNAEIDLEEYHSDAQKTAAQCMALLKNEGILPLVSESGKNLLIAGALAVEPNVEGSGSGYMNGYRVDVPLEEIKEQAKCADMKVSFCQGYSIIESRPPVDPIQDEKLLEACAEEAAVADIILAFVGAPYGYESESYDRPNIQLPSNQKAMLDELTDASPNVVIILTGGSVYDLAPWSDKAKAILFAGFAGEGYGKAVVDVLFGNAEPGGRLTETFPLREEHGPSWFNFTPQFTEMASVNYGEGLLVGYRWYDTRKLPVLYPFGHGLSYTQFSYSDFSIDKSSMTPDEEATVSLKVTNTGSRPGSEVIQLYVHECGGLYLRPEKELRDFAKIHLNPGESEMVTFTLGRKDFELYSDTLHKWGVQSDTYDILLGTSAKDIQASGKIEVTSGDPMSEDRMFAFTEMTPLVQFVNCPAFHAYLKEHKPEWMQDFFDLKKTDFLVLMLPLPFYRLAGPLQGEPMFTTDEIEEILDFCNQTGTQPSN